MQFLVVEIYKYQTLNLQVPNLVYPSFIWINIEEPSYFEKAKNLYEQALKIDNEDYMTNFYYGILYYKEKEVDDAYLQKALEHFLIAEQSDANTAVLFNIAVVYDEIGDYDNSEKYYLKILDVNKNNTNDVIADAIKEQNLKVYNNLALLSKKQGKINSTIHYYQEGLNLDPNNFPFLHNLGLIFYKKGDYNEAIRLLNQAILSKLRTYKLFTPEFAISWTFD